jgi:hypothetical protein
VVFRSGYSVSGLDTVSVLIAGVFKVTISSFPDAEDLDENGVHDETRNAIVIRILIPKVLILNPF